LRLLVSRIYKLLALPVPLVAINVGTDVAAVVCRAIAAVSVNVGVDGLLLVIVEIHRTSMHSF